MPLDYYGILGIAPNASTAEIKRAFRRRAHVLHPDRNPLSEERFIALCRVYRVLADAELRSRYDAMQGSEASAVLPAFWRFWRRLLGMDHPENGSDLCFRLEVEPDDLRHERSYRIELQTHRVCPACGGSAKERSERAACALCDGSGRQAAIERLAVRVPAGIEPGTRIRLRGLGGPGLRGGSDGDLFIEIACQSTSAEHRDPPARGKARG
ncbi:MAG: J domain-containing protein [Deltaproteobacteria bacterium]|nr:J domain-containing protein [Deltaproteobacteria bacterium]